MSPSCWLRTTADSCSWRRKVNPDKHGVLLSCCWARSPVWGGFSVPRSALGLVFLFSRLLQLLVQDEGAGCDSDVR